MLLGNLKERNKNYLKVVIFSYKCGQWNIFTSVKISMTYALVTQIILIIFAVGQGVSLWFFLENHEIVIHGEGSDRSYINFSIPVIEDSC